MSETIKCFKDAQTFESRKNEATRVRNKYPNRIPVIVERAENCNEIEMIDKKISCSYRFNYGTIYLCYS